MLDSLVTLQDCNSELWWSLIEFDRIPERLSLPPCPARQNSYSTKKVPEMEFSDHVDIKNAQEHYQTPSELGVRAL